MLQSLDKLRDKTLSLGCYIDMRGTKCVLTEIGELHGYSMQGTPNCVNCGREDGRYISVISDTVLWDDEFCDSDITSVYGHPLTRGRLCYLHSNLPSCIRLYSERLWVVWNNEIQNLFPAFPELYDQDETQRMKHEQRPKLEALLVQFAELLRDNTKDG